MIETVRGELTNFLKATVEYVRSHAAEITVRSREQYRVVRENGKRQLGTVTTMEPDYAHFLVSNEAHLCRSPSFINLLQKVRSESAVRSALRLPAEESKMAPTLFRVYLIPLSVRILQRLSFQGEEDAVLVSCLQALDTFAESDTFEARYSVPLLNCTCTCYDLEIANGVYVRSVSDNRLESYLNSLSTFHGLSDLAGYLGVEFELEKTVSHHREIGWHVPEAGKIQMSFSKLKDALRLVKHGAIGFPLFYVEQKGFLGWGPSWSVTSGEKTTVYGDPYELKETDLIALRNILPLMDALERDPRFSLAMRRFISAYNKPIQGDRLVDYWIGLESLLMPDGKEGELRFRAALRLAYFLQAEGSREDTFKRAKNSYDARSDVVHGTAKSVDPSVVMQTEEFLRLTLRRCLELKKVPTGKLLDSLVLGVNQK